MSVLASLPVGVRERKSLARRGNVDAEIHLTWAYAPRRPWVSARAAAGGRFAHGRPCDDFRLVGLKLIFLTVTRAVSVPGLSRRETWWKDAEIVFAWPSGKADREGLQAVHNVGTRPRS